MFRNVAIVGLIWMFAPWRGLGRDAVELESSYRGNGWFEYRLRTLEDPFFTSITFASISPFMKKCRATCATFSGGGQRWEQQMFFELQARQQEALTETRRVIFVGLAHFLDQSMQT